MSYLFSVMLVIMRIPAYVYNYINNSKHIITYHVKKCKAGHVHCIIATSQLDLAYLYMFIL